MQEEIILTNNPHFKGFIFICFCSLYIMNFGFSPGAGWLH